MFKLYFYIYRYFAENYFNFVRNKKKYFFGYLVFGFFKFINLKFKDIF